jgi:hypothetical protein
MDVGASCRAWLSKMTVQPCKLVVSMVSGDIDNDMDMDMVVLSNVDAMLYINDGNNSFSARDVFREYTGGVAQASSGILLDVDGDGDLDLPGKSDSCSE